MRKRSVDIIKQFLFHREVELSIEKLAYEYKLSSKTIRNDLKEINTFFNDHDIPLVNINKDGILVFDEQINYDVLKEELRKLDLYVYRLSAYERTIYILSTLLISKETKTMQQLADELQVSRGSIISDFENINTFLQKYQLDIIRINKRGITMETNKIQELKLLYIIFKELEINQKGTTFFQKYIIDKLDFKIQYIEIYNTVNNYVKTNNFIFMGESLHQVVLYLFVAYNYHVDEELNLPAIKINQEIQTLVCSCGLKLNINISNSQLNDFAYFFTESQLDQYIKTTYYIELYEIINYFVSEIGKEINIHLEQDNLLIESLLLHIKSLRDWDGNSFAILKDIRIPVDYEFIQDVVFEKCEILESYLNAKLQIEMKYSILLHICASLIRYKENTTLNILIVCAGSMATGKYLEAQLKNYFNFNILSLCTGAQVSKLIEKNNVDLIISSIPLKVDPTPVVVVNALLSMDDLNRIQKLVFNLNKNIVPSVDFLNEEIIQEINYFKEHSDEYLISQQMLLEISALFNKYKIEQIKPKNTSLHQILKPKYIKKEANIKSWELAMVKSSLILQEYGYINNEYIIAAINNVKKYGDYIIISEGIALAHAGKNDGVIKNGLSLLVIEDGVVFQEGRIVKLLFTFASCDDVDYSKLFKEIINIGKDLNLVEAIVKEKNVIDIYYRLLK